LRIAVGTVADPNRIPISVLFPRLVKHQDR